MKKIVGTIEDAEIYRMLEKMTRALVLITESRTDPKELSELLRCLRDKMDGKDSS